MDGGGGREEGPGMGSRNSISFAHRLQIILQLPNMGMTWGQLLPPSTIPMPIALPHPLFRSLHRNLIFHSDSAMGVNCAGLAKAKISARDFSTNSAPAGHSRRPSHLRDGEGEGRQGIVAGVLTCCCTGCTRGTIHIIRLSSAAIQMSFPFGACRRRRR